jgi:hypothetical protein
VPKFEFCGNCQAQKLALADVKSYLWGQFVFSSGRKITSACIKKLYFGLTYVINP